MSTESTYNLQDMIEVTATLAQESDKVFSSLVRLRNTDQFGLRVRELEAENARQRSFMQMKDNAKIKVERDRDAAKAEATKLLRENEALKVTVARMQSQHAQNTAQAEAYQRLESELYTAKGNVRHFQQRASTLRSQRDYWESKYQAALERIERIRAATQEGE